MLYEIKVNISEVNEKMNVCSKEIEPTKKKNQTKQTKEKEKKSKKENSRTKIKVSKKFTDWVQ